MKLTQDMKYQLEGWMRELFHCQYGEIKPGTMSNWETGMAHGVSKVLYAMYKVDDTRTLQAEIMGAIFDAKDEARKGKAPRDVIQAKAKESALKTILSYLECVEMIGSLEGQQP